MQSPSTASMSPEFIGREHSSRFISLSYSEYSVYDWYLPMPLQRGQVTIFSPLQSKHFPSDKLLLLRKINSNNAFAY